MEVGLKTSHLKLSSILTVSGFLGVLRINGKNMPLKFFYPWWRNGERIAGTLDGNGYYNLLRYHCFPFIRNQNDETLDNQYWQQDGASCNRTRKVIRYLHASFENRLLVLGGEARGGIQWCLNSPDLAPLDFCIWGVMRSFVLAHLMPTNGEELVS